MPVNLEQIEMLRERANVSYGEAKEILEKCHGDVLEALIYLEGQSKVKAAKSEATECGFGTTVKGLLKSTGKLIKKGNEIKFIVRKKDNTVVDLPLNLVLLTTVLVPPVTVIGVLLALFTNHRIAFKKPDGRDMEINKTLDKISTAVNTVSSQVAEAISKD